MNRNFVPKQIIYGSNNDHCNLALLQLELVCTFLENSERQKYGINS